MNNVIKQYVSPMDTYYQDGVVRPSIQIGENVWVADNSGSVDCWFSIVGVYFHSVFSVLSKKWFYCLISGTNVIEL